MILYAFVPGFYAEIERRRDATLLGRPVIVGGDPRKKGTVQAMTSDVPRTGVEVGMLLTEALQRCPEARVIRTDMKWYREVDAQFRACLRRETHRVESAGLGAAYLDLVDRDDSPKQMGQRLSSVLRDQLGLPLRVGAAPVKFLAKIASEKAGIEEVFWIRTSEVKAFLDPLPVGDLPGVGPRTESALNALGVKTAGQLARLDRSFVDEALGNHGLAAQAYAQGQDASQVRASPHARSLSQESTLKSAEFDRGVLAENLAELARRLDAAMAREALAARRVILKVSYADDAKLVSRSRTLTRPISGTERIYEVALELLERTQAGSRGIRRLGLSLQSLVRSRRDDRQLDLFKD